MNGKLIFKMIDDYILGKFDIKKLDNYFQFKNKIEDFDEDLFNKFVNTYKYARTQTNAWDENDITNSLIKDIMTALNNHSNLSFNVFKSKGTYETSFGDIAKATKILSDHIGMCGADMVSVSVPSASCAHA